MNKIEHEPVAWRAKSPDRIPQFFDCERDARLYCGTSEWIIEPLYLHPQPAPEVAKLVEALQSLLDMQDQDCRYDHQGYCQNHNLDHIDVGCRVQKARTALAAYRK